MKLPLAITGVALALMVSACAEVPVAEEPAGLSAEDEAAIRALVEQWDRNVVEDFSNNADLFTDDYVEMRSTGVEGKEAARELYAGFGSDWSESVTTVRELEGRGDLAYMWVSFTGRYANADGERRLQNGNSLWVLRKGTDGQWRFSRSGFGASSRPDAGGD